MWNEDGLSPTIRRNWDIKSRYSSLVPTVLGTQPSIDFCRTEADI